MQIMNPIPFISCNVLHFAPSQPKASKTVLIQELFSADAGFKLLDFILHLNHILQGTPSHSQAEGTTARWQVLLAAPRFLYLSHYQVLELSLLLADGNSSRA